MFLINNMYVNNEFLWFFCDLKFILFDTQASFTVFTVFTGLSPPSWFSDPIWQVNIAGWIFLCYLSVSEHNKAVML